MIVVGFPALVGQAIWPTATRSNKLIYPIAHLALVRAIIVGNNIFVLHYECA